MPNWASVAYECVGDPKDIRWLHDALMYIEEAAKCVSDIVGHPVEPNVEAIDQALDDYLTEHEDNDTWYSFHEFIEDVE